MHGRPMTKGRNVETALWSPSPMVTRGGPARQGVCDGGIRGRGSPPGSGEATGSSTDAELSGRAGIRGRGGAPGSVRGGSTWPARGTRERERSEQGEGDVVEVLRASKAAEQHGAGMKRYFASIADAVEKRKSVFGERGGPSAADRMAALRQRIASRARGAGEEAEVVPAAAQRPTVGQTWVQPRDVSADVEAEADWNRRPLLEPAVTNIGPGCSTARTEAATAAAHHAIGEHAERQNVVNGLRRLPPAGASASWRARQGLLDRLRSSASPPEYTD